MAYLPELTQAHQSVLTTSTFLGYDHRPVTQDGALYDMDNLCGDAYPLLTTRRRSGVVKEYEAPRRVAVSDSMVYVIDDDKLWTIGAKNTGLEVPLMEEIDHDPNTQIVFMGTYLCVFPQGKYINTKDLTDAGTMGVKVERTSRVIIELCKEDGTDFDKPVTKSTTRPQNPENGDLWLDTSAEVHSLKQYNAYTDEWINVLTTFVRLRCIDYPFHVDFKKDDVITISGLEPYASQVAALGGDQRIYAVDGDYIVIAGIIDQGFDAVCSLTFERKVPQMDYVIECDNRLWGCRYGVDVDGKFINEIYACKLGDFKNWRSYQGISTDSYAATVGTDGPFTGAAVLRGSPVFFKEDCVHKISGKTPGNFTITTTDCAGVQKGGWDSLKVVNETLYYKGNTSVMAYDGSVPTPVSDAFGNVRYSGGIAGVLGKTYYLCTEASETGEHVLFSLDTETGLWYKQQNTDITCFASIYNTDYEDNLFYTLKNDRSLHLMRHRPDMTKEEEQIEWTATFGTFGYEYPDRKYLSRFNIRMKMDAGAEVDLYIQYDSDGVWNKQGCMRGTTTRTYTIPVIPRRCDHCQVKLAGRGAMTLYSISRVLEMGGDG